MNGCEKTGKTGIVLALYAFFFSFFVWYSTRTSTNNGSELCIVCDGTRLQRVTHSRTRFRIGIHSGTRLKREITVHRESYCQWSKANIDKETAYRDYIFKRLYTSKGKGVSYPK